MRAIFAAMLAGGVLCAGGAARADEAPSDGHITVTATKKAGGEGVQDVPAAITVFTAKALADAQFRDLQSLSYRIPGVSLDQVGTFRGVANFAMRGLGINSSIPSIDASVGTVVDGVYVAANAGLVLDQFDIGSVEVVRGPQGVLFGRNTTGGAVLVNTADPSFDWQVHARISGEGPVDGGRGAMRGTGQLVVSGPLSDKVAIRLGAFHDSDGGYFKNLLTGANFGKAETTVLRAGLKALITDRLTLTAKGEYLRTTGDGATTQDHGLFPRDGFAMSVDNPGFIRGTSRFAMARLDWQVGPGTLTNIAGWRHYDHATSNDIDSSPSSLFHSNTGLDQQQWSDELRWSGKLGALDLTAGGYLFHQQIAYAEDRALPTVTSAKFYGGGTEDHHVQGLFVSADFHATAALTLTAGLRWSHEVKRAALTFVRTRPACWVVDGSCPVTGTNPLIPGEANGLTDRRAWSSLSPKVGLGYKLAPGALAYASWTRGTRSGGYNLRVTQPAAFLQIAAAQGTAAFGPERVDSFEAGLKLQSADGRATFNAAAYRTYVDGVQREISVPSTSSGLAQYIYNTGNARITGGEIEGSFAPVAALRFTANLGYIDAGYTRVFYDLNSDGVINAADTALKLPRAPKWTVGGGAAYDVPLGGAAMLTARADYQYRSRYAYTDNNWGYNGSSDMLDASIAVNLGQPAIKFTLYGRNLLDAVQFGGDTQIPFGAGALSDGNNRPFDPRPAAGTFSPVFKGRVVGVEAALDF